jgi:hypothetical protein
MRLKRSGPHLTGGLRFVLEEIQRGLQPIRETACRSKASAAQFFNGCQ